MNRAARHPPDGIAVRSFIARVWQFVIASMIFGLLLAACSSRGTLVVAPATKDVGTIYPIFVATSRAPVAGPELFSKTRSDAISYMHFDVSVPPDRKPGTVKFPTSSSPNPRTEFFIVSDRRFDGQRGFIAAVNTAVASGGPKKRDATLFVHGYNTNFAEGLYRPVQLLFDMANPSLAVHYSWPSAAQTKYYVYDLESAIFARDGLESTITALSRTRLNGITLVGHSMGCQVVMETMRQMTLSGHSGAFSKLKDIVLISPDVNLDLFRGQLAAISRYDIPIYIVVSGRDRALRLSARLRGERLRVGDATNIDWEKLDRNVKLIDLTDVKGGDPMHHFSAGSSPAVIALVRHLNETGVATLDTVGGGVSFFNNSTSAIQEGADVVVQPLIGTQSPVAP